MQPTIARKRVSNTTPSTNLSAGRLPSLSSPSYNFSTTSFDSTGSNVRTVLNISDSLRRDPHFYDAFVESARVSLGPVVNKKLNRLEMFVMEHLVRGVNPHEVAPYFGYKPGGVFRAEQSLLRKWNVPDGNGIGILARALSLGIEIYN